MEFLSASVAESSRHLALPSSDYLHFTFACLCVFMPRSTLNSLIASLHLDDFMASSSGDNLIGFAAYILHLQRDSFPSVLSSARTVAFPNSCSLSDEWSDEFVDQLCISVIQGRGARFECGEFLDSKLVHYVR